MLSVSECEIVQSCITTFDIEIKHFLVDSVACSGYIPYKVLFDVGLMHGVSLALRKITGLQTLMQLH